MQPENGGQQEEHGDGEVEDGEDADRSTRKEAFKEVGVEPGVVEDSGDQEAGEHEEEVDAVAAVAADFIDQLEDLAAMRAAAIVAREDREDGESANPVERRKSSFEVDWCKETLL